MTTSRTAAVDAWFPLPSEGQTGRSGRVVIVQDPTHRGRLLSLRMTGAASTWTTTPVGPALKE